MILQGVVIKVSDKILKIGKLLTRVEMELIEIDSNGKRIEEIDSSRKRSEEIDSSRKRIEEIDSNGKRTFEIDFNGKKLRKSISMDF